MNGKILAVLAGIGMGSVGAVCAAVLDNGSITVEVSGDGSIGSFQYPASGVNHLTGCKMYLRYGTGAEPLHYTEKLTATEKAYDSADLFTGYGREQADSSNFFVCSASYLDPGKTYVDQTIVVLTKQHQNTIAFSCYFDPKIMGEPQNDMGSHNIANNMISIYKGVDPNSTNLGLVATLGGMFPGTGNWTLNNPATVLQELRQNAPTAPSPIVNDTNDMAGAVVWPTVTADDAPKVLCTRLIIANSDGLAQGYTSFPNDDAARRVHVLDIAKITPKKFTFKQNFKKAKADKLTLVAELDLASYTNFASLSSLDVSLFMADYISLTPTASPSVDKPNKRVYKLDTPDGKTTLTLKLKKGKVKLSLNLRKTTLTPATYLTTSSPNNGEILMPFAMVFTGTSADPAKNGISWIVAKSYNVKYKRQKDTVKSVK